MLIGEEALKKLNNSSVAIFGIGGVGGYITEALARIGVGSFTLVDNDTVSESNINRQIIASHSTIGRLKTEVMKERILDINPDADIKVYNMFYLPENADEIDLSKYSYVVDAVDTVTAKLEIISRAKSLGVPVVSSMGTGNKLNPAAFFITDIYSTEKCPLARVMRRELRKRGVDSLKVVCSAEDALTPKGVGRIPGSVSFVPSVAGIMLAGEVVKDIIQDEKA